MKAILEFNLPEERDEFKQAQKAADFHAALWDIQQKVFRPARKHGYSDTQIQALAETEAGGILIEALERMFWNILEEHGVEL